MHPEEFLYDLAISFVAKDETLATQLADQFEGRLKVFLYSRKQEQLAGTDGEKTFNDVFAKQSRLVVVLYRTEWGETPWTRIEETAIRNRAFDEGYSFVLFIPLDEAPSVPKWLPRSQLWIGLNRWGLAGAASVIDARFQELGGIPKQETLENQAARLEKAVNFAKFREQYHSSMDGVSKATAAFESVTSQIALRLPTLQASAPSLGISIKQAKNILVLVSNGLSLRVNWRNHFINSLSEAEMEASLWRCHPPYPGVMYYETPRPLATMTFLPDVLLSEEACWTIRGNREKEQLLPEATTEHILSWWLERALKDHKASR
jgi:hypothetical protein